VKEAFSKQALLTPPAGPDQVFTWRIPGLKLSVQIRHDLIERLHEELLLSSSGENPNSLQGVLVGRHVDGPERAIVIDDYELAREQREEELFRAEADAILALASRVTCLPSHRTLYCCLAQERVSPGGFFSYGKAKPIPSTRSSSICRFRQLLEQARPSRQQKAGNAAAWHRRIGGSIRGTKGFSNCSSGE
jgi:hypothetical protein